MLEIVITLGLGAAGLYLAHSVRRQMQIRTADARMQAYTALWEAMKVAAPGRATAMSPAERSALHETMTDWYFNGGHGMMMTNGTRQLYLTAKENLVRSVDDVVPISAREPLAALPPEERAAAHGKLSMRQLSLLRTRMKADLAVYGQVYDRELEPEDEAFLRACGENLRRRPWRASIQRTEERATMTPTARDSTIIGAAFLTLVGAIAVTALIVYEDVDDFLKVWAVLGTLVGVVTGAIPSFFFSRVAREAQEDARENRQGREQAEASREQAESRSRELWSMAGPDLRDQAAAARPDLFATMN